jgi:heterodisulfide reductase subunit A-like polyferredoxin
MTNSIAYFTYTEMNGSLSPVQNIEIFEKKPSFKHKCEFCLEGLHSCPIEAIDYRSVTRGRKRYRNPKSQ